MQVFFYAMQGYLSQTSCRVFGVGLLRCATRVLSLSQNSPASIMAGPLLALRAEYGPKGQQWYFRQ
jgi:hypothetical protein